jgi:hypothetical protein
MGRDASMRQRDYLIYLKALDFLITKKCSNCQLEYKNLGGCEYMRSMILKDPKKVCEYWFAKEKNPAIIERMKKMEESQRKRTKDILDKKRNKKK